MLIPLILRIMKKQYWIGILVILYLAGCKKNKIAPENMYFDADDGNSYSTPSGTNWTNPIVTYSFGQSFPSKETYKSAIRRALQTWDNAVSGLTFTEANGTADIMIGWGPKRHISCPNPFEEDELAHGFYPPPSTTYGDLAGDLHIRSNMDWSVDGSTAYDLETTALHEIGHILGLGHTTNESSVMFRRYSGIRKSLTQDDIDGVCSLYTCGGNGTTGHGYIVVSGDLNFGAIGVGNQATRNLSIGNMGGEPFNVSGITFPPGFSGNWSGIVMNGSSQQVPITFTPTSATSYSGNLVVNSNAQVAAVQIPVSGSGAVQTQSIIALSGNLNFGSVAVGGFSTRQVDIANTGSTSFTINNITLPAGFTGSAGGIVNPGSYSTYTITFRPTSAINYGGNLVVNSNAQSGTNTIAVSGAGSQAPAGIISLSGNMNFGTVNVGGSATNYLTISNTGNASLNVSGISFPNGFSGNWSGAISSGSSHQVLITFSPNLIGSYGGTISVNSNSIGGVNTISVSGVCQSTSTSLPPLLAYYPFEGNINDQSGNQRNMTISGTANYQPGINGNAFRFTENQSGAFSADLQSGFFSGLPSRFSISIWLKPEQQIFFPQTGVNFWGLYNASSWGGLSLVYVPQTESWTIGNIGVNNFTCETLWQSSLPVSGLGVWHHIVTTINGTNNTCTVYLDGTPSGSPILMQCPYQWAQQIFSLRMINGFVDQVRIFDGILTQTNATYLFSSHL